MLKLIKLEIKKFKLIQYWKGVVIANLGFIALLTVLFFIVKNEGRMPILNFEEVLSVINALVRAAFQIFASVLIVKLIIDEYKSKSIEIMFTYPIGRKKIMTAKMIIITMFTFITVFSSTIFIGVVFYCLNLFYVIIPGEVGMDAVMNGLLTTLINSIAAAGMSLIPLIFGMIRKSAPATIIAAVIGVSLTSRVDTDFDLFSVIAIPITLGLIGLFIGYLSIRNIEKADVR
ncbi:ABC transporter permease [Bacillus sp. JJ722]|uniref:ABC transporter permease n=1 Tax=Bacillus sp. JJ722 TaxID=3122973 RepID=UPI0030000C0D